jgi:hypothetical protein
MSPSELGDLATANSHIVAIANKVNDHDSIDITDLGFLDD